jgi:ABC-type nitrate/sulfonate/bicarbonate transport system permease component
MFAGILVMSLLGLLLFVLVDFLQHLFCPWLYT